MSATLGILVPTLKRRRDFLRRLMARLQPQLSDAVAVYTLEDEGVETIGRKRQRLIESAETPFVAHVDDDDLVAPTYVADVLGAIAAGADVVGFRVRYFEDGALTGLSLHSLSAGGWGQQRHEDGLTRYARTPNHLNPVRREMALEIGFKSMNTGEDADYSRRLFDRFGATMREVFVDKFLYDYLYRHRRDAPVQMYADDALTRAGMEKTIREGGSVLYRGRLCTTVEQLDG